MKTRHGTGITFGPTNHSSAASETRARMSTRVLLITRDSPLKDRLTIESVDRVSDATQRLRKHGSNAVMMDWDMPATHGLETLLVLMGAAPELPIIILDDDPDLMQQMSLIEHAAQVTLNSIGDAVLSTDGNWRITFLNPVAERLIGWTHGEASGLRLTDVFQVIDATARERIVPCLEFEVGQGRTVILPPNCMLVRRDGQQAV
jgi:PAS domain-containing protein